MTSFVSSRTGLALAVLVVTAAVLPMNAQAAAPAVTIQTNTSAIVAQIDNGIDAGVVHHYP